MPCPTTGCWLWIASLGSHGYGQLSSGFKKSPLVTHRLVYELLVGPIPDGLHIDHLCRNRPCCNPMHLEPVTQKTNNARGVSPITLMAVAAKERGCCPKGHPHDEAHTRYNKKGHRSCKTCNNERMKATWRERLAARTPEQVQRDKETARNYYLQNKERVAALLRASRARRREEHNAQQVEYRRKRREQKRQSPENQ
jgi:hypothetical protein